MLSLLPVQPLSGFRVSQPAVSLPDGTRRTLLLPVGINESLKGYENPIETMDEDTKVKIEIDPEKLYYNMVEAKATWLYELPQWDAILTEERRTELYREQKASGTVRNTHKIYPNDPCPCGSGKKYKKCCGKNK